jgi:hypothetical protein
MKGNNSCLSCDPNGRFWNLVHGHESAAVDPCRHGRARLTDLGCAHVFVVSMTKWSGTRPPLAGSEIRPSIGNDAVRRTHKQLQYLMLSTTLWRKTKIASTRNIPSVFTSSFCHFSRSRGVDIPLTAPLLADTRGSDFTFIQSA